MVWCVLVEDSGVEDANLHMVDSYVAPLKHEKTVAHHTEAHVAFRVTSVGKLVFVKYNLSIVLDWIVLTKHMQRQVLLWSLVSPHCRTELFSTFSPQFISQSCLQAIWDSELGRNTLQSLSQWTNCAFVGGRKRPIHRFSYGWNLTELDSTQVFMFPVLRLVSLYRSCNHINCVQL